MEPRRLAVLVLAACALALPFLLWGFRTYQLAFAASNAIAILGLNLIAGQVGLISLGHGAFYGLGAYTLAVLMRHWSVPAYAATLAAGLVGLVTGYVFGRVVTRLVGFYLALTTFALGLALPQMLKSSYVSPWTGGAQGLYLDRPGAPLRLPVTSDQWWYFVSPCFPLASEQTTCKESIATQTRRKTSFKMGESRGFKSDRIWSRRPSPTHSNKEQKHHFGVRNVGDGGPSGRGYWNTRSARRIVSGGIATRSVRAVLRFNVK